MLIRFSDIQEHILPGMNHGSGEMSARMYMDQECKIIPCKIHSGGSIGMHSHPTSDDINYILSGTGKTVCDGTSADDLFWTFEQAVSYYKFTLVNYIGFQDKGMLLAGGCGDTNGKPQIEKTEHLKEAMNLEKNFIQ